MAGVSLAAAWHPPQHRASTRAVAAAQERGMLRYAAGPPRSLATRSPSVTDWRSEDSYTSSEDAAEASPVPRSDFGQKVIFGAFYRQSSNFAALVRPLRARARAGDRPGHTILAEYLRPTEPGSAETAPVLRGLP